MTKKILVSFSGGLDSTYLVYKNLKEGHTVTGLYTVIKNNENKAIVERYQIERLKKLFDREFPRLFKLEIGTKFDVPTASGIILSQISIWLFSLLYNESGKYDEVHIGAVMNDDLISYIDDIKKQWKSYSWLNEKKHPRIMFPLIKYNKGMIFDELPKKYSNLVVFCEDPKIIKKPEGKSKSLLFERCGNCMACVRYETDKKKYGISYSLKKKITQKNMDDLLPESPKRPQLPKPHIANKFTHKMIIKKPKQYGNTHKIFNKKPQ